MFDLVVIPFHDWKKVQREGSRTRDAHLIREFSGHPEIRTVVIVNRPTTYAEMLYRRTGWKTQGNVIARNAHSQLVRLGDKLCVVDTIDRSLIRPVIAGKRWFLNSYGSGQLLSEVESYLRWLEIGEYDCISFSVFAAGLFARLNARHRLFDAWDNFLKFPSNHYLRPALHEAYRTYASSASTWTTNSDENKRFYEEAFGVASRAVIRNGVRINTFRYPQPMPDDLASIPRPVAGMGLKVTHLLDTDLLNRLTEQHPNISFALIGQILDKSAFAQIAKRPNFYYLGDKHYEQYAAYVQHFDLCLIPYHTGDKQHGGDAIKFYEYLAANKPVVSTRGNGVSAEFPAVWLADTAEEFSKSISVALQAPPVQRSLPQELTWTHKADTMLSALHSQPRETLCPRA